MNPTPAEIQRFWAKVVKDGPEHPYDSTLGKCWLWKCVIGKRKYGGFWIGGKQYAVHCVSLFLKIGPYAPLYALHSCDNRECVNPAHIYAGTAKQNIADMDARGRRVNRYVGQNTGSKHGMSKLTEDDVREMRAMRAGGMTFQAIADHFSMGLPATWCACVGKRWKHVV